jgi:hypothetical protein
LVILATIALAGCQSGPVYAPQSSSTSAGYSDKQLAANRYRVSFHGDSATRREIVEDFLLRRAAEVTQAAGYAWFIFDQRDTKARTRYYSDFAGWPGWPGYGWYWHNWDFGFPSESVPITNYTAYAEIILLTDSQASGNPRALNAKDVLAHLGPPPEGRE